MLARRRNEIDLCARLLGVAAHALRENAGLLLVVIVIKVVLVLLVLPMFGLMFLAFTNGQVVPNGETHSRLVQTRRVPTSLLPAPTSLFSSVPT